MTTFELILLTIERDLPLLSISLPYIIHFIKPSSIKIIASSDCLKKAKKLGLGNCGKIAIGFLNEDKIVPGLTIDLVRTLILERGGESSRAGWYFKQIINLVYSMREDTADFYLTWDADTIPVRDMNFFDQSGRVCMTMKEENHAPYFNTSMNLIGIGKIADGSFIAEHMMFERKYVRELLKRICGDKSLAGDLIAKKIIQSIASEDLNGSGFAEYEIYGSFMYATARERISLREMLSSRHGTALFGRHPAAIQLFTLSKRYYWASFEKWEAKSVSSNIFKVIRRIIGFLWTFQSVLCERKKYKNMKVKIKTIKNVPIN